MKANLLVETDQWPLGSQGVTCTRVQMLLLGTVRPGCNAIGPFASTPHDVPRSHMCEINTHDRGTWLLPRKVKSRSTYNASARIAKNDVFEAGPIPDTSLSLHEEPFDFLSFELSGGLLGPLDSLIWSSHCSVGSKIAVGRLTEAHKEGAQQQKGKENGVGAKQNSEPTDPGSLVLLEKSIAAEYEFVMLVLGFGLQASSETIYHFTVSDESQLAAQGCYLDDPDDPVLPNVQTRVDPSLEETAFDQTDPSKERDYTLFSPDECVETCRKNSFLFAGTKVCARSNVLPPTNSCYHSLRPSISRMK